MQRQLVIGLGAMKSGTTWLSNYLSDHPEFFHSPIKETNAFSKLFPFNSAYPGYTYNSGTAYRLWRMEKIILSFGRSSAEGALNVHAWEHFDRLRALAQLGRISSVEEYLDFFNERIASQQHFGEFSPSYSHLPADAYLCMASISNDVRFLFVMRDPTHRAASHLRHLRRRICKDIELEELLDRVNPSDPVFIRSDYRYTLQTLRDLGLARQSRFLIYEELFTQRCIDDLCNWLGIEPRSAAFDGRLNSGVGAGLSNRQMAVLRDRLAPIYNDLRLDPATRDAKTWLW